MKQTLLALDLSTAHGSIAVVRALVTNEGRLCCAAQGTLLIREPRK